MFDVTPSDILLLNDEDLRELVGRLCEAELASQGASPVAVTWGGNQTAADGGLDVRVALPLGTDIDGFIPRPNTGFQAKTPDMARAAILAEMCPNNGPIRPVIQELANARGSYIIVSSHGSTADIALNNRRAAMREALAGMPNADQLHVDFYDRTRLATWVRRHPGLVAWVKEKIGRSHPGWHPYGAWSGAIEGVGAEYLLDDKLRLNLGNRRDAVAKPVADAIDELRDELLQPGKVVRLVGLSGVGKTRFVQALFDARIGSRPLPPSLAVYANLSDNPNPQPTGLVSDLIANRMRVVVVIDNCPPDLHRRLSELCSAPGSTVSLITVEYDVRGDQPEATQVVTLDTSSPELIERLVARRYPHLSQVDARTIAEASGGNARIAIALAGTVGHSETIAGLSDDDLFIRLFQQRHEPNDSLLRAAHACSLVYSFQGEAFTGDEAELLRLAVLADETPRELFRHVGELQRRDLVQQRSVWRAVLPHAIANRLAARALEDTPADLIDQQLVSGGTERLALSFSRRLSYLHEHERAMAIVAGWLAPGGFLGDATSFNEFRHGMFKNVAPVLPERALAVLERAENGGADVAVRVWRQYQSLLRSLAYEPDLFERSAFALVRAAMDGADEQELKETADIFLSLFTIYLSGTHASVEQRIALIERLIRANEAKQRSLGLGALEKMLEASSFSSSHQFEFGARSRDYGYQPTSAEDITQWYEAVLDFLERLAFSEDIVVKAELRDLLSRHFRALWSEIRVLDKLEHLFRRFAGEGFWNKGWAACSETMHYDRDWLAAQSTERLAALEAELRPSNLPERVRAMVLSNSTDGLDLVDMDLEGEVESEFDRPGIIARELGMAVATDEIVLDGLIPDLLRGGNLVWSFGNGLASRTRAPRTTWVKLVEGLEGVPVEQRDSGVLRGYLAELWDRDRGLAQDLLDAALHQPALGAFFPLLQSAMPLDERGSQRLKQALLAGLAPIWMYRNLALGRTTDQLAGGELKDLLLQIADQPDGFDVAVEILSMRYYSNRTEQRAHELETLEAGRELLRYVVFRKHNQRSDYKVADIARPCLAEAGQGAIAADVATRLRQAVSANETFAFHNIQLLQVLFNAQPVCVLEALFEGGEDGRQAGVRLFTQLRDHGPNPASGISCAHLIEWCNRDRTVRYPLAASFVSFKHRPDESGPEVWSEQATALLANAPEPIVVLAVFVDRFRPLSWSGSRAALMESNARLLDDFEGMIPAALVTFVAEAKDQLAREIAAERRSEDERDQVIDERFE